MAKSGHHFPSSHGFKGSTGKVQNVRGYTRAVPKARGGPIVRPVGMSSPKPAPFVGQARPMSAPKAPPPRVAPVRRPLPIKGGTLRAYAEGGFVMSKSTIGDQGNSAQKRGNPPITEFDADHGGRGPLAPGYKRGGLTKGDAKKIAKTEVAAHVSRPAPKGHKGFNKTPLFGKK